MWDKIKYGWDYLIYLLFWRRRINRWKKIAAANPENLAEIIINRAPPIKLGTVLRGLHTLPPGETPESYAAKNREQYDSIGEEGMKYLRNL